MFDDIFNNKKCMICGNVTTSDSICSSCEKSIMILPVNQSEIVNELVGYYIDYEYIENDNNKLIQKSILRVKVKKFIDKMSLQKE